MAGRKPKVPPTIVLDAILQYKDRVVVTDANGDKSKYLLN